MAEDRCICCGDVIPKERLVCMKCECMAENEAIVTLDAMKKQFLPPVKDILDMAIKSLKAQIKLKEYIERINQPEYKDVVWKKDEVVLLLQELIAE